MREKALVLDIDGTLTNSKKEITSATRAAILGALERGHKCVLASGRPAFGMYPYAKELALEQYGGYLISYNGACMIDCGTGEILYGKPLPVSWIPALYDFAAQHHCGLATHLDNTVISAFAPDPYVSWEAHINGMPVRQVENFPEFVNFDVYKCFMTAKDQRAAKLEKELQGLYGDALSVYRSEPYFIEIVPKGIDKGNSLGKLMEQIGIAREDVICCGDGFNDISMIRYAGMGVAMGNAQQAVKDAADFITASNDEDGLVPVIRRFLGTVEQGKKEV